MLFIWQKTELDAFLDGTDKKGIHSVDLPASDFNPEHREILGCLYSKSKGGIDLHKKKFWYAGMPHQASPFFIPSKEDDVTIWIKQHARNLLEIVNRPQTPKF